MSETMDEITQLNISSELNLIFAMSRMLVTTIKMARTNPVARTALRSGVEAIFTQASILLRDVNLYADTLERL